MSLLKEYPQLKIIQDIAKQKKVKVYLVGGFLRDYFLGRQRTDFDFAVSSGSLKLARSFAKKIKGAFVLLDKDRGCARVVRRIQNDNSARSRQKSRTSDGAPKDQYLTFDFADFRVKTLKGDMSHRDFTINAICVDVADLGVSDGIRKKVIDVNKGLIDLKAKRIKMTSAKCFKEDPLRLVRAFSLKSALDFRIEVKTLAQIKKDKDRIREVSPERVRDELFKILRTSKAAESLKSMDRIGLLERMIPQIHVMYNVKQGGYHHLDVWPHSLETVKQLEKVFEEFSRDSDVATYLDEPLAADRQRFALIKLAALLHDIGKPDTRKQENGRLTFHGHEHIGKVIVKNIIKMLKLSTRERFALENMVRWHLRPGYLSNFKTPTQRAVFRYFRDSKEEAVSILLLSLADQRSTRGPMTTEHDQKHHEKIIRSVLKQYFEEQKKEPFVPLIDGNDLIKRLKLKPSPLFAKILDEVEEKQSLGKVKTKKEALELASKVAK